MRARFAHYAVYAVLGALLLWAVADFVLSNLRVGSDLEAVERGGTLVIATMEGPATFYEGRDGLMGYEHDLAVALAQDLGVDVRFRTYSTVPQVLSALRRQRAHIAAAGLTKTPAREEQFTFGPAYQTVKEVVICRRDAPRIAGFDDLAEVDLAVMRGSSFAESLEEIEAPRRAEGLAPVTWREIAVPVEELLARVAENRIGCTVADTSVFRVNRRLYPVLEVAYDLTPERSIAWALPQEAEAMQAYLEGWFAAMQKDGFLAQLDNRYFSYFPEFDYVDISRFRRDIEEKLPQYERLIRRAARETGLPWQLLAAISYQESRWEPEARSHTGVRGFMMLTRQTAVRVGVEDRLDPEESIDGGARYFAELVERVPEDVQGQDRYWFALAAYNMGMGHLYDARALAERRGLDKSSWTDLREVLPLLMDPAHYKTLRHGYARGREAQRFVSQVRSYLHIIEGVRN